MVPKVYMSTHRYPRSHTGNGHAVVRRPMPSWATQSVQTGDIQQQIMKKAEEYWWKSGYIEGLKTKLGDAARKSAFPAEKLDRISSSDAQLNTTRNNGGQVRKADDSGGQTENRRIHEGLGNRVSTNTDQKGMPLDPNNGQVGTSTKQINTRKEQAGINRYADGILERRKAAENKNPTEISQYRNTEHRRTSEIGRVRQTSITDGQSRPNNRQVEISNGQKETSIETNPVQKISKSIYMGQTGIRNGEMSTNRFQPRRTQAQIDKNIEQSRPFEARNNVGQSARTDFREWKAFMGSITEQTRTTKDQSGTTVGRQSKTTDGQSRTTDVQPGTTDGRSGTTDGQLRTSNGQSQSSTDTSYEDSNVQQENAEISKSSPGKQNFVCMRDTRIHDQLNFI